MSDGGSGGGGFGDGALLLLLLKEDEVDDGVRVDVDDGRRGVLGGDARQGIHCLRLNRQI